MPGTRRTGSGRPSGTASCWTSSPATEPRPVRPFPGSGAGGRCLLHSCEGRRATGMSTIYGLIHEPDARCAPRFRPRVNGRWIDIQLAEALLIHDIIEDWLRPAREAMAIGAKSESEHVAVRDLVADKHRGKLEVDFDSGMPTVGPG